MLKRNYKIIMAALLSCVLIAWTASATEVLVKIDLSDEYRLSELTPGDFTVRFRGKSFLLLQGDEDLFRGLPLTYFALDEVKPDFLYYLTSDGRQMEDHVSQLEEMGSILFRSGDSALLRIHRQYESRLIALGLPLAPLPESVELYPQDSEWTAPRFRPKAEMAEDAEVVGEIIGAVSVDVLRNNIRDLQENKDLDPPRKAFRSRYTLRVRETDDPSDDACDNAADYIFNKFKSYGLDVEFDPFSHEVLTQGNYLMRNVVATLPGKGPNSDSVFIVCAHYDSIALKSTNWLLQWKTMDAPGANDNASGTAGVLEAARILSNYDFDYTIKFITFAGEELGLHGSIHYSKLAAERQENIVGVLNLDTMAYDPDVLDIDIITNEASEWLGWAMLSTQREYNIGPLVIHNIVNPEMVFSDHSPFWHYGWNAILAIDNSDFDSPEFYPFIHTTEDTIDKLNFHIASMTVQVAIGTLANLADPIGGIPRSDLAVTQEDISFSPENPEHGQLVQVTANIHNIGEAKAENARVQIWLMEPFTETPRLIAEEVVDVLAGDSVQVSAPLDLNEWGNYRVLIKANPDYQVFEINGINNIAGRDILMGSTLLALGGLIIYPNPLRFDTADRVNIAYSLSKDAATRLEIYSISGELLHQSDFASGAPGGRFGPNDGIEWDGTNLSGENVSSGVYLCNIVTTDENNTVSASKKIAIIR